MNEWALARGRMEAEFQRRKEHINFATNFEATRGFVRTNWKTKNFNPADDPTQYSSSSEDYGDEIDNEARDKVEDYKTPAKKKTVIHESNSEERDQEMTSQNTQRISQSQSLRKREPKQFEFIDST